MVYFLLVVIVYCWASTRSHWFERSIACNNVNCHLYVVIYLPFITLHFMCHTKLVACHLSFALHATHQVFNISLALHVTCHLHYMQHTKCSMYYLYLCHLSFTCILSLCISCNTPNMQHVTCYLHFMQHHVSNISLASHAACQVYNHI
jgi:hypothetical protein